jgi:ATP-dependent helicase HrpA
MAVPEPAVRHRELLRGLDELLLSDAAPVRELLQRAGRRLDRGQPADRLLEQAAADYAQALAAPRPFEPRSPSRPMPATCRSMPSAIASSRPSAPTRVLVLCGETGSGKTTQLPKLCLDAGRGRRGLIGHTQPRRIAARSVAARIAEELGSGTGGAVGHKVRFNDQTGPGTRIKLMTDGILLAELRQDRDLLAYDTLIIDEAHERSLNIDFLLGYLKQLLPRRPDLRVIITSATLDPERLARFFDGAPIIEVPGRAWPVEVRYRPLSEPANSGPAADGEPSEPGSAPAGPTPPPRPAEGRRSPRSATSSTASAPRSRNAAVRAPGTSSSSFPASARSAMPRSACAGNSRRTPRSCRCTRACRRRSRAGCSGRTRAGASCSPPTWRRPR